MIKFDFTVNMNSNLQKEIFEEYLIEPIEE